MPVPNNYSAPEKLSAKDSAYNQIRKWIIDGTLAPGEKILDTELSGALKISRTPIREALQLLCAQGFIEMKPGRETVVTGLDEDGLNDILPPLAALQSLAAQLAAPHAGEKLVSELRMVNGDIAKRVDRKDFPKALELDERFHTLIVRAAGNKYVQDMADMLQAHVRRYHIQKPAPLSVRSVEQHAKIADALESHKAMDAANITKLNWLRSLRNPLI